MKKKCLISIMLLVFLCLGACGNSDDAAGKETDPSAPVEDTASVTADTAEEESTPIKAFVTYSEFGAKGDGVTNDIAAIIAAHEYANANQLPVKADEGATYYISEADAGAIIQTDTDWTGATFIIDDSKIATDKKNVSIFTVRSQKQSYELTDSGLTAISREADNLGITLPEDSIVNLTEADTKQYIRKGPNQNSGEAKRDILIVSKDGSIDMNAPLIWDYTNISSVTVRPMDTETLTLKGGTFITIANQAVNFYGYYARNIRVVRSNTVVDGFVHLIEGEGDHGAPYNGFLNISQCANVTVQNCTFTGHKRYDKPLEGGGSVGMGTYDFQATNVINLTFKNCIQSNDINDKTYWGIMNSNYCKNITLDGCEFSRFDAHQGVANATILNSTLGHTGVSIIGFGTLRIENTTSYGEHFIMLRGDYGSSWEGDLIIKDCTWIPYGGERMPDTHSIIGGSNDGSHDFGYTCYLPANITVDGFHIEDGNATKWYKGIYLLANFNVSHRNEQYEEKLQAEGYPIQPPEKITVSGFSSASGHKWRLSSNQFMFRNVEIEDLDGAGGENALGGEGSIAENSVIIISEGNPTGGGSRDIEILRDGIIPKSSDSYDTHQYDTFSGRSDEHEEYFGYMFNRSYTVSSLSFTEGAHFSDGGWFKDGSIRVEVLIDDEWMTVETDAEPAYPIGNQQGKFGKNYQTYTFTLKTPVSCDGIRIIGLAGGAANFTSAAELSVEGIAFDDSEYITKTENGLNYYKRTVRTNKNDLDHDYYYEGNAGSNDSLRFCDLQNYLIYHFNLKDASDFEISMKISQNYLVEVSGDLSEWIEVADYSQGGTVPHLPNGSNYTTLKLKAADYGLDGKDFYICIRSCYPDMGHGGAISQFTITYTKPAE